MTKKETIIKEELKRIISDPNNPLEKGFILFFQWLLERPEEARKTWGDFNDFMWWTEGRHFNHFFIPFISSDWVHPEEAKNFQKFQKKEAEK